ncbi:MAG TPA: family 43 glycosylhydrolase, partial [Paenibacillus sp.]|nr:family 43 glycosylhydrolase [Paenibacillus sp.]
VPNTTYAIKIVASGATISTYVNGALIDTTVDATFAAGKIGFRQYATEHAHVDNVRVAADNPVLFSDTFGGSLHQWTAATNSAIEAGELSLDNGAHLESATGSAWSDYSFEADVNIKARAAGLNFRVQDGNNYYMWQLSAADGVIRAHKKTNGSFAVLKEVPFPFQLNTTYRVKIVASGYTIATYINDTLADTTTDATFGSGKIGFRQYIDEHAHVDNVTVFIENPAAGMTATPFQLKGQTAVNNVKLQWHVPNATRYEVYRSVNGGNYDFLQSVVGNSLDDYGLTAGNAYRYSVKAFSGNTYVASAYSSVVAPYAAPGGLKTFDNTASSSVQLPNGLKVGGTYYKFNYVTKNVPGRLASFKELVMQTSSDDVTYGNDTVVLRDTDHPELANSRMEGLTVVYHAPSNRFVLWAHYENDLDYSLARLVVASATPGQSFTYGKSFRPMNQESRDMSLFKDEDGTAYIVSSGNGNADLHLFKLTSDWLDVESQVSTIYRGLYREAPHLVKKDGFYYLFTSQTAGWYPSKAMYSSAPSLSGPWSSLRPLGNTSTFSAQSGWLVSTKPDGGGRYAMMAPRWMFGWQDAPNANAEERFLPLSFSNGFAFFDFYETIRYDGTNDILIPVQDGKIVSQGKTAASSANSADASKINDGDYYTSWVGPQQAWPYSWTVDLGQAYSLSDIQMSWFMHSGSEAYYRYKVEGSLDGTNYTTLLDRTSGYNDYGFTANALAGAARHVRVTVNQAVIWNNPTNWYTPQLFEVKVFGQ